MRLEHCADNFISNIRGKSTGLFFLKNARGSVAAFTNYGARWVGFELQTNHGIIDPVCGFDSIEPYRGPGDAYYGAITGRYANRINKGKFEIEGKEFSLPVNNGPNHLHGGPEGLHQVVWKVEASTPSRLHFSYRSQDGEGGYPGELNVDVIYSLSDDNEVGILIRATTNAVTIVNITNHAYFNLAGKGGVEDHFISINADQYITVDEDLIPLGEIRAVHGPFDLRKRKRIGDGLSINDIQLERCGGYDHCFVLNGEGRRKAAFAEFNGLRMDCITDQPGMQFYSGNFMNGLNVFRSGSPDNFRNGFCLEAQKFPDSPNNPSFPSVILNPGEEYINSTSYRFTHL